MRETTKGAAGKRRCRRNSGAKPTGEDVRVLARDAALAALTRLADLAKSDDERVALAASQELLNRAFGKSLAAAPDDQGGGAQPLIVKIVRFGAKETTTYSTRRRGRNA